jgi:hypothetical protein
MPYSSHSKSNAATSPSVCVSRGNPSSENGKPQRKQYSAAAPAPIIFTIMILDFAQKKILEGGTSDEMPMFEALFKGVSQTLKEKVFHRLFILPKSSGT